MKRTLSNLLIAFLVLGTGMAFASGRTENQQNRDGLTGSMYRVSEIEGFGIMGPDDEKIGDVDDVVLSLNGQLTHLVVSLNDAQGVEDGKYLVLFDSFRIYDTENVTIDLQQAHDFYVYEDDSDEQRAQLLPVGSMHSSDLRSYDVYGQLDERIAGIHDVVVDLETSQVVYVAIVSGGFLGVSRTYHAVAFDQIQIVVADERVRLSVTEDDLESMEGFVTSNWPARGQDTLTIGVADSEAAETREAEAERDGLTGSLYRMSKLQDFAIIGQTEERIGNAVEPLMTREGYVTHLIAHLYDVEGLEDGRYIVPFDAITMYDAENISVDIRRAQEFTRFADRPRTSIGDFGYAPEEGMTSAGVAVGSVNSENRMDTSNNPSVARPVQLPEGTMRSSEFLNYDVVGPDDEVVAGIEDLVVDMETGQAVYVAISSGGFIGIDQAYHTIWFDLIQVDEMERRIRISMTEAELAELEGFDDGFWPSEGSGRRTSTTLDGTPETE